MPTAAKIRQQIANMALALVEVEKAEEAKKITDAEAAKEAAEVQRKADEAEAKWKADEAKVEKDKKATKTEVDKVWKDKVCSLAVTKRKGKEVEKTPEVEMEVETKTQQDCDSCVRKELICKWKVVSRQSGPIPFFLQI
jgi:hypothetical protein